MHSWLRVSFLWGYILLGLARCRELEDPFLLPYGPKNGDMFATRDGCSLGTDLEHSFKIGNKRIDKVYVCLDGLIKFSTPPELFGPWWWWEPDDFDWINDAIVAPFLSAHEIDDRFLDARCSYSVEENSFYGYDGADWCRAMYSESFDDYGSGTDWYYFHDSLGREEHLEQVKQLHDRNLTREQLEILVREDDETARRFYGKDTTKYVNLADNVMRRQVTEGEDLEILTKLIQTQEGTNDVTIMWALVITWYKIQFECYKYDYSWEYSSNNEYDSHFDWDNNRCFASFQLSVACSSERCFSVFNYFEVNGRPYYWSSREIYCGLFTEQVGLDQPIQCLAQNFSHEQLVQGSNIGVKGVWVYELDQRGQGNVTFPDQLNHVTDLNELTIKDFHSYDQDEPFLLKFGLKANDTFLPATYYDCSHAENTSRHFMFGIHEVTTVYICRRGYVSFTDNYVSMYYISRGYYIYYDTAVIAPLIYYENYDDENFFDYTCLLFDNPVYQTEHYFNDVCFHMATRNFVPDPEEHGITFDDEKSKILFGVDTTKYVNLAGNMFKREITSAQDLEIINQLIGKRIASFDATSGYVVTWYKIGSYWEHQSFNSFQSIIACGDDKDCVVIYDYYEMQWGWGGPEVGAESAWVHLNDTLDYPDTLTNSSNFGIAGIWVFYFPGDGSEPVTNFEATSETNDEEPHTKSDEEEPFLLPFGPKHNDSFSPQHRINYQDSMVSNRVCSFPQILESPLTISGIEFDWLFVCLNGVIEVRSFEPSVSWGESWASQSTNSWRYIWYYDNSNDQYEGLDIFALQVKAFSSYYPSEANVNDDQVDYLCQLAQQASSQDDLYFQYLDYSFCPDIPKWWDHWNWWDAVTMMGWTNEETLASVVDWNTKGRHEADIDFKSDDSLSELIFGAESTKYINLANNFFRRESTNDSDLQLITEFIRTNPENSDFQATWCAVATWYKVASASSSSYTWEQRDLLQWFNSFQLILACDNTWDVENATKCFAIYDYFQVQSAVDTGLIGIYLKDNAGYKIPVAYEDLSRSSNYGSPGIWVFDLSNLNQTSGANPDISFYDEKPFDQNEEPFLLPFGPKHGDQFFEKDDYDRDCSYDWFSNSQLTVNFQLFQSFQFCTNGLVYLEHRSWSCGWYWWYWWYSYYYYWNDFSNCEYPVFAIYPLERVNTEDNLIDYMCSENYLERDDVNYWVRWDINEFCPLIDNRRGNGHPLWWWYSEYEQNQLGVTDEQRQAIQDWNDFISDEDPRNVDIYTDDELARAIFGSDTTKYVNLANNVFKRETQKESDLSILTSFMQPVKPGFEATWAFVATWYKIAQDSWPRRLDYNSYQTVITCDVKTDSTTEDDACFVIFDYFEIQWTGSEDGWDGAAQCGVKENGENFVELPTSGTEEVRNLWVESNIEVPGMWVIELSQKADNRSIWLSERQCVGSISPEKVLMQAVDTVFTLSGYFCSGVPSSEGSLEIEVIFTGAKSVVVLEGKLDEDSGNVTCELQYWGEAEEVDVTMTVDGVTQIASSKVLFYNPSEMLDPPPMLHFYFLSTMKIEVPLDPILSEFEGNFSEINITFLYMEEQGKAPLINTSLVKPTNNTLSVTSAVPMDSFTYVICFIEAENDKIYSDPVKGGAGISCDTWVNKEEKRDLSRCVESLSRWYGCPRETNTRNRWWGQREDEWYARTEVSDGVMGWQYDVCCNDQNLGASDTVSQNGYCNNCQFNPGADFCIKSIPVACEDGNTQEIHYVSNQCCYSEGNLIEESEPGVGTMHLEESTAANIVDHSEADLEPYKSCCLEGEGTEGCDTFYKYRPVVKGSYWSRVVRAARGDPHITTVDNTTYTFNGLNVYTLLITNLTEPTDIQASTRVSGKGTLFSGLAVKYKTTVFECFITKDGEFNVAINNEKIALHEFKIFISNDIIITEDSAENSFTFFFTENDVIIKVLITNSFLNFFTSVPPTFHGQMVGLLGFYDGKPENDLRNADGETVNVSSNMTTIHNDFGETWAVSRRDWIFQYESFVQEILQDLEDGVEYEASYEATFDSPEQEEQAREVCGNDAECLLDVALTGNISFAEAFNQTKTQLVVFDVLNEVFISNVPNATEFQQIIEEVEEEILELIEDVVGDTNNDTTTNLEEEILELIDDLIDDANNDEDDEDEAGDTNNDEDDEDEAGDTNNDEDDDDVAGDTNNDEDDENPTRWEIYINKGHESDSANKFQLFGVKMGIIGMTLVTYSGVLIG